MAAVRDLRKAFFFLIMHAKVNTSWDLGEMLHLSHLAYNMLERISQYIRTYSLVCIREVCSNILVSLFERI